jgi:VanZ like family.
MHIIKSFWKPIAWSLVVLILSGMTGETVSKIEIIYFPQIDKIVHFTMYFVFTFLMMYDFTRYKDKIFSRTQIILFSLISAILYGGGMELLQRISALHRSSDIRDFIANSIGAIVAVLLYKQLAFIFDAVIKLFTVPKKSRSL